MKRRDFIVALWPIGRVKPYAKNARTLTDAAVDKVARSLELYGWRQPIVVELDPKYVDVIVKRWQTFTGKEATLEATGAMFNALSRSRAKAA